MWTLHRQTYVRNHLVTPINCVSLKSKCKEKALKHGMIKVAVVLVITNPWFLPNCNISIFSHLRKIVSQLRLVCEINLEKSHPFQIDMYILLRDMSDNFKGEVFLCDLS